MRGQPFWRLAIVVAVFAMLAVPLWQLTRPAAQAVLPAPSAPGDTPALTKSGTTPTKLRVSVTLTAGLDWTLGHLGQTVLAGTPQGWMDSPEHKFEGDWTVNLPGEGGDLVLRAALPPGAGDQALRVVIAYPDGQRMDRTFWTDSGGSELAEVITVPAPGGQFVNP